MAKIGKKDLAFSGINICEEAYWNLTPTELFEQALINNEGKFLEIWHIDLLHLKCYWKTTQGLDYCK